MNPKIEVEIGANIKGLQAGIAQADNAIDKLGSSSNQAAPQIAKLTRATSSYNSVGIEFSRIVQDAPFGIIGVANNITQLTQSLQSGRAAGQSYGQLLSGIFTSGNLLVLGISALTSAFVVLQQKGFFKTKESVEDLDKSLKDFNQEVNKTIENLSRFERAQLNASVSAEKERIELDSLFAVLKDSTLAQTTRISAYDKLVKQYPNLLKGLTQEKALTSDLKDEYNLLNQAIQQKAVSSALEGEFVKSIKEQRDLQKQLNKEKQIESKLQDQLAAALIAEERQRRLIRGIQSGGQNLRGIAPTIDTRESERLTLELDKQEKIVRLTNTLINGQKNESEALKLEIIQINKQLFESFNVISDLPTEISNSTSEAEKLKRVFEDINKLPSIGLPGEGREDLAARLRARREQLQSGGQVGQTGPELINNTLAGIKEQGIFTSLPQNAEAIANFAELYQQNADQINQTTEALVGGFSALGNQIAASLDIGNDALKGFIGTLLSNTPKIIQAIFQQAAAKKAASAIENQANLQVATGNAVAVASKAANALGPVGLALLPVFVGGALALISGAFKKGGGGGGGAGGVGTSGISQGTSFTGQGQGATGFNRDLTLRTEIDMDRLVFYIDQAKAAQI